ncbi:hypothetical protein D3C71_1493360 [compost metagenome]
MEFLDGELLDERRTVLWRDDRLAVWLVQIRRHLGEEFVIGNTSRSVQPRDRLNPGADFQRDVSGNRHVFEIFGHVEIGLVERQRFDDRRVLRKNLTDLLRDGAIDFKPGLNEDQIRTFSSRRD